MQRAQVRIAVFIFNRIDRGMSDAESFGELLLGQIILAPEGFPLARAVCSDITHSLILDNWREPPPLQSLPPFVSAAFQCYETWSIWKPVWVTAACVTGTATEVWKLPS